MYSARCAVRSRRRINALLPWWALCSVCGLVLLAVLTPFLLTWLAPQSLDWTRLSAISQTYAAVSIPLSGAALIGVVWSLLLQARAVRADTTDRFRQSLRELLLVAVEDDSLLACWDPPLTPITREEFRLQFYNNAIINGWRAEYQNGTIPDPVMRDALYRMMRGQIGRRNYASTRELWWREMQSMDARSRRFLTLMEEAFQAAVAEGPALAPGDYFLPDP
ncbi:DUF6082 family protein [Streptomyces sp. NPDC019531]|uniref:DUF6082 family protein n=1 Tax=Streptomyces sp. NPDC019531 TaxID=3365062 RepID=UPI00384FE44F